MSPNAVQASRQLAKPTPPRPLPTGLCLRDPEASVGSNMQWTWNIDLGMSPILQISSKPSPIAMGSVDTNLRGTEGG